MLKEMAVADAYAIAFEFVKKPLFPNDLKRYYQHPRYPLKPSWYTDDTQRALANARCVIADTLSPGDWIASLQQTYRESPRLGYSERFQAFLETNLDVEASTWLSRIKPAHSNGGIMGILPLAYLPYRKIDQAVLQAVTITHHEETARWGQILVHAAHCLLTNAGTMDELDQYLRETIPFYAREVRQRDLLPIGPVEMTARDTALKALGLVFQYRRYTDIIKQGVDLGGDTDSVCALAIGLASCSQEHENDLPDRLVQKLEDGDPVRQQVLADADRELINIISRR